MKIIMRKFENEECRSLFHITFKYKTKKGREKQQDIYIKRPDICNAENMFWIWIDIMKNDYPKYTMKDVKIISIKEIK